MAVPRLVMAPSDFKEIRAVDIKMAVQQIAPYLEDTSNNAPHVYFDGWLGLGASAVLRTIAEQPPPSLRKKFDKIIHIDCSMWKSRRALQRVIVDELKLTQQVVVDFERQDDEDDFSGVDQGSRVEIEDVSRVIAQYLVQYRSLVVFHNGSEDMVHLTDFGIPILKYFVTKVLWTFRGGLRLNSEIYKKVEASHIFLHADNYINQNVHLVEEEAREIYLHTHKLDLGVTPKIATECCLYLLTLKDQGKMMIDYNWTTHASSYWVCDGIIGGQQDNQTWEVAHALQQHIRLEAYSPNTELMPIMGRLDLSSKQWISITEPHFKEVPPETTTLFFAPDKSTSQVVSLPSHKFHKADQLRVLKLCGCTFNFSSPPFHCCCNLRFLGLDRCKDVLQQGEEEEKKTGEPALKCFQRLWVLDVCQTDWPLDFPPETKEQVVATDIREIHINNGKIWRNNLTWSRLPNLYKLRVVEPTNPWETTARDEFIGMVNLELLDLSGNSTIQVLPSLSGATCLKTLILDGCIGLEHVVPQGLPPSLESFSLDVAGAGNKDHKKTARISYISLAGCARLEQFILCGPLPNLEELDLSRTAVKMLDLGKVDQVGNLQRVLFIGCRKLRSISWPKTKMSKLRLLCIDTREGGGEVDNRKPWLHDRSLMVLQDEVNKEYFRAYVALTDMRFLQSLRFLWRSETIRCDKWNLCLSSGSNDDGRGCHKQNIGSHYSTRQLAAAAPSQPKSLTYHDISIEQVSAKIDVSSRNRSSTQFLPLDLHMEIGEGISDVTDKSSTRARDAICEVMNRVQSLHVHDSSSITSVAPEHIFMMFMVDLWPTMDGLKWCCVDRCPKLDTVFVTQNYLWPCFSNLEIFWAAHLLMSHSIWSRPRDARLYPNNLSFTQLRAIHLHFCPRLIYVLPMASNNILSRVLETLHIHCCGDLKQIFLMEKEFLEKIEASHEKGMLEFSTLKSLYLYELPNLQQICEAKMLAPKLETIFIRGCWGLRRFPAIDRRQREGDRPVVMDCEKECWDKLEWDGLESGHHPTLFEPRHSKYCRRRHLRGTVLR